MTRWHIFAASWLLSLSAHGAGPAVVAKADRQLWQEPINSIDGFDKASRATLLVYIVTLNDMQKLSDTDMKAVFKIKTVNRASVTKWFNKELALTILNYQNALKSCTETDWTCIGTINSTTDMINKTASWQAKIPATLSAWHDNIDHFSRAYVAEQLRLAALFPKVSSEIDFFNDNEWNGDNFADRQFLLTFDDGPTKPYGDTDDTLALLAANQKSAVFFVLGENLQNRLHKTDTKTLAALYKNQCVAIHGWEHQSHAKWASWQESIKRTQTLITTTLADNFSHFFRPPYGQRKADSGGFFQQQGLQVTLWNLDSQDWNNQVNSDDILNRMLTLMLIKRHGVLLFHDVHPKAKAALPVLFNELGNAVEWQDCYRL
ncbi:MAG: polysaccharide deacetylase family protein [Methylococcaceae bacterium]|nr:polysaccharide deacetylase family protein [Methylococcaceae bacterium]